MILIADALRRRRGPDHPCNSTGRADGSTVAYHQSECHRKPRGISRNAHGIDSILLFEINHLIPVAFLYETTRSVLWRVERNCIYCKKTDKNDLPYILFKKIYSTRCSIEFLPSFKIRESIIRFLFLRFSERIFDAFSKH